MPDLQEAVATTGELRKRAEELGYTVRQKDTVFTVGSWAPALHQPNNQWYITSRSGELASGDWPFWSRPFDTEDDAVAGLSEVLRDDARVRALSEFGVRITPWQDGENFSLGADTLRLPMGPYDSPGQALDVAEQEVKEYFEEAERSRVDRLQSRLTAHQQNMPSEFHGLTLENFNAKSKTLKDALEVARQYVNVFSTTDPKGLVLCGERGTGKTTLAVATAASLTVHDRDKPIDQRDLQCHYKTVSEAISADDTEICKPGVLLLDWCELQASSTDSHGLADLVGALSGRAVANLLAVRYEANLATLLIADCDQASLYQYLGLTASRKLLSKSWEIVQLEKAKGVTKCQTQ